MSPWLQELLLSSQTDERLVALVRSGHERAFTAIVERHRAPLHRFARRAYGQARADDLVQQTFLYALCGLRNGTEVAHLRAWLHQILRHAAIRTGRGRDELGVESDWDAELGGESLADTVERRLEARGALVEIARLPPRQRDAFVRTAIQGRSRTEVADALGLSEGAVRQLVHRARVKLRRGATALTPAPLLRWLAGPRSHLSDRLGELTTGAGAVSAGGVAVKFGALLASGIVATGIFTMPHGGRATGSRSARDRPSGAVAHRRPGPGDEVLAASGATGAMNVGLGTAVTGARPELGAATGRAERPGSRGDSSHSGPGPSRRRPGRESAAESSPAGPSSGSEPRPADGGPTPSLGTRGGESGVNSSGDPGGGTGGSGGTSDGAGSSSGPTGSDGGSSSSSAPIAPLASSAESGSSASSGGDAADMLAGSRDLSASAGSPSTQGH